MGSPLRRIIPLLLATAMSNSSDRRFRQKVIGRRLEEREPRKGWAGTLFSRSPVSGVQFWALVVGGLTIFGSGLLLLRIPFVAFTSIRTSVDVITGVLSLIICALLVALGLLSLRRAFAGRH
jgi:hypothetical protein